MNTIARRVQDLVATFEAIARSRMAGLPVLNLALRVEAVGFAPLDDAAALGVLVTPWFMNLVHLPLVPDDAAQGVGRTTTLELRGHAVDFIGAHEPALGAFAACSLFSPVFDFPDPAAARAVAEAVLADLHGAPVPARRSFLFGGRGRGEAVAR